MSQRKGSVSAKDDVKCGICAKIVGDKEPGIQCEVCEKWWHTNCVKIPDDVYKVLGKIPNLHWFCEVCNLGAHKILANLTKLNEKVDQFEIELKSNTTEFKKFGERMDKVDMEIKKLRDNVDNINRSVQRDQVSFRDIMKKEMEDEVKRNLDEQMCKVSNDLVSVQNIITETRTSAIEERDKEVRRNNVIIYQVPESSGDSPADRVKNDTRVCLKFFDQLRIGLTDEDILSVIRLGKHNPTATNPCPLLVKFADRTSKNLLMENLYKIRSINAEFQNFIIAHDMTKNEREQCRTLVSDAKQKTEQESGEWRYVVRGSPGMMKIVKLRKRN